MWSTAHADLLWVFCTTSIGRRDRDAISEDMRAALNAFLYNTGTETSKFMLVLATNQPQLLDSAVVDRVDSSVLFDLPVRRKS